MNPSAPMEDLREEISAYENIRTSLLRDNEGKFVIMHGKRLVGVYDSSGEAFVDAMNQFGTQQPFLLRQVSEEDSSIEAPALTLGLIDAKLP